MPLQVEATGETVGEAKWSAVRELERMRPGLDKSAVRFQVVSEGERGLLGVGFSPARVIASVDEAAAPAEVVAGPEPTGELADRVREVLATIAGSLHLDADVTLREDDDALVATLTGSELGRAIGRHGQTIDAVQYLVNAIVMRAELGDAKPVVVDAAGYRDRRESALHALAIRVARRVADSGSEAELEPMSAVERKIVHLRLKDFEGVETRSEGTEPNRFVVVFPASESPDEDGTE